MSKWYFYFYQHLDSEIDDSRNMYYDKNVESCINMQTDENIINKADDLLDYSQNSDLQHEEKKSIGVFIWHL